MNNADSDKPEGHLFGHWHFNANSGNLSDGETTTRLAPQVAKLLAYFLDHQNTLTSRDQLIATVWESRIVSDDAINRCVSILRQILSPDNKNAYIETVVRRGFISHFPAPQISTPQQAQQHKRRNRLALLVFAGLSAVFFYSAFERFSDSPAAVQPRQQVGIPMVAVLPFSSSGSASASENFASGIHDDLLTQLAQIQSIRVISRTSVLGFKDTNRNIREIGMALGADAVLEGGIQYLGNHIRINAQLIDAQTDEHLWAGQYDRELLPVNIFAIQTEITQAIASALQATLSDQDSSQLNVLPTENMAAYSAYHKAMKLRDTHELGNESYNHALEEAVALDPDFVRAWAELAGSLSYENFNEQHKPESIERIENILEKIHTLAPESAEYMIAQAYYTYYVLKDYERSHRLIQQAHSLRPSDARVLELKSWIERRLGDFDAKIKSIRLAQKLDPRNPMWTVTLTKNLITNHQYDEANQVIESSGIKSSTLAVLQSMLLLRDYQGLERWVAALTAIEKEFDVSIQAQTLWDANIAIRDYEAAERLLDVMDRGDPPGSEWTINSGWTNTGHASFNVKTLITHWFLKADDQLNQIIIQGQATLDSRRNSGNSLEKNEQNLALAFLAVSSGNKQEAERMVRVWQRGATNDLAEMVYQRHLACRALGMAAATTAAVECIRSGLVEPSLVMPFIEPFLPYYDSIRDQAEFVDLLTEIQQ